MSLTKSKEKLTIPSMAKARGALIGNYWWVFLFLALCGGVYSHALQKKNRVISQLHQQHTQLIEEKQVAQQRLEDLTLQVQSQSDPAWIELMLMKGLGVVPEGQQKVYFSSAHSDSVKM